jgi:protein O-GlcNAc transferase
MSAWTKSLAIEPTPETLRAVGRVFAESGQVSEAVSYFEAALKRRPGDPDVLCDLGHALLDQGRLEEASKELQFAVASSTGSTRTKRALAVTLNNLGVQFAKVGKLEEALDCYSQAVQLVPTIVWAWRIKGKMIWIWPKLPTNAQRLEVPWE